MLTEEQKKQRLGRITSSLAAACLGLDKRKTPRRAWLEITGREDGGPGTKATKRGDLLEDIVLDHPAEKYGLTRVVAPFVAHPELPFGDSADAIYLDAAGNEAMLGEGKTAALGLAPEWGEEGTDEVPDSALIQSHWHLGHRPHIPVCVVPVLIGGWAFEFRDYIVKRDDAFVEAIFEDLARWHRDYVVTDKMPPAEAGDTSWLERRYPRHVPEKCLADSPEIEALARAKKLASEAVKAAELHEESIKNRIRDILGDHEAVLADWGKVTWKNNADSREVQWEALARALMADARFAEADAAARIAAHTVTKPGARVLRVHIVDPTKKKSKKQ